MAGTHGDAVLDDIPEIWQCDLGAQYTKGHALQQRWQHGVGVRSRHDHGVAIHRYRMALSCKPSCRFFDGWYPQSDRGGNRGAHGLPCIVCEHAPLVQHDHATGVARLVGMVGGAQYGMTVCHERSDFRPERVACRDIET